MVTTAAVCAIALAIGFGFATSSYRARQRDAADRLAETARTTAQAADGFVDDRVDMLQGLARTSAVQRSDRVAMKELFAAMRGDRTFLDDIGWVPRTGRGAVSGATPLSVTEPLDFSDRDYVREVLATGAPYVSEGCVAASSGSRSWCSPCRPWT